MVIYNKEKKFDEYLDIEVFKQEYKKLGGFSFEEGVISFFFILCILLWVTRSKIGAFPGWQIIFKNNYMNDR
jgi:di/tricarboxylate transporter